MPPHCDSLDGPVVTAAREALEKGDADLVLPYVREQGEAEVREAFRLATTVRTLGSPGREVADRWFFETVVRVHRAGEGAPFTGLKPAGLDIGPVIPVAERAVETGSADELARLLCDIVRGQVEDRHRRAMACKEHSAGGVSATREYVEAALGLEVWAHHLYQQAMAAPHEGAGGRGHGVG